MCGMANGDVACVVSRLFDAGVKKSGESACWYRGWFQARFARRSSFSSFMKMKIGPREPPRFFSLFPQPARGFVGGLLVGSDLGSQAQHLET